MPPLLAAACLAALVAIAASPPTARDLIRLDALTRRAYKDIAGNPYGSQVIRYAESLGVRVLYTPNEPHGEHVVASYSFDHRIRIFEPGLLEDYEYFRHALAHELAHAVVNSYWCPWDVPEPWNHYYTYSVVMAMAEGWTYARRDGLTDPAINFQVFAEAVDMEIAAGGTPPVCRR